MLRGCRAVPCSVLALAQHVILLPRVNLVNVKVGILLVVVADVGVVETFGELEFVRVVFLLAFSFCHVFVSSVPCVPVHVTGDTCPRRLFALV